MITVKLSYSIISKWEKHEWEEAISMYRGGSIPLTPQIELGRVKDKFWSNHALTKKEIHPELGGGQLINPIVQQKYEKIIPLGDKYQILWRGVPDLIDENIVYDFKCGWTSAKQYMSNSWQLANYKFLVPSLTKGVYLCYNPYLKTYSKSIKYFNKADAELVLEKIITFGGEIIDYLQSQHLLINYERP